MRRLVRPTAIESYERKGERPSRAASQKPEGQRSVRIALANTHVDVNGTVRRKLGVRELSFAPVGVDGYEFVDGLAVVVPES